MSKDLAMDPKVTPIRIYLAQLLASGGEKERALHILLERCDYPSSINMTYYQLGKRLAAELGDSEAEEHFKQLIDNYPENYPIIY